MNSTKTLPSTKDQRIQIMAAIQYHTDYKRYLALKVSNERTDSLTELYFEEAEKLIQDLENEEEFKSKPRYLQYDLRIKRHRYILGLCRQLTWTKEDDRLGDVVNMTTLFGWLMSAKSPVNKSLMDLKDEEITRVIGALEGMVAINK